MSSSDGKNRSSDDDAYAFGGDADSYLSSPESKLPQTPKAHVTPKSKEEAELLEELTKTEEEIATLRLILSTRIKRMQEIKRQLGITVWKEFRDDMEQGIHNIQESTAFQKTYGALETFGATVSKKFEGVKNSAAFKTIEEKVGTVVANVKTKVGGSAIEEGKTLEQAMEEKPAREKSMSMESPDKH